MDWKTAQISDKERERVTVAKRYDHEENLNNEVNDYDQLRMEKR